jgi:hypothetical protein
MHLSAVRALAREELASKSMKFKAIVAAEWFVRTDSKQVVCLLSNVTQST